MAIAVVIAIGTGVFAALGSTATWRRVSNDASFERLRVHDLELRVDGDTTVDSGRLLELLDEWTSLVTAARETLTVPTQLEIINSEGAVLVPGRLVTSVFVDPDDPTTEIATTPDTRVDVVEIGAGRSPRESEVPEVVLEEKFLDARAIELPALLTLAGGSTARVVGSGVAPQDLIVSDERSLGFFTPGGYAVVYGSPQVIESLSGITRKVNGLVVDLVPDADPAEVADGLRVAASQSGLGITVTSVDELPSYRLLYDDIEGDQRVWRVLSALILGAAALAAFNLVGRVMDAQRREIGVQMALGLTWGRILRRPLIMAAQIALIGAIAGIGVGVLMAQGMRSLFLEVLPMPVWLTPFQTGVFAQAAVIGFAVPFVASVLAARRILRLQPVESLHPLHRTRGGTPRLGRPSARGRTLARLPVRNTLRAPRRSLLTALGVGAAVASLVAILGLLDTFVATIERGEEELTVVDTDPITVQLTTVTPVDDPIIDSIRALAEIDVAHPRLELPIVIAPESPDHLDALVTVLDLDADAGGWAPRIDDRHDSTTRPGVVLATKALEDLNLEIGDDVVLEHPTMGSDGSFRSVQTSVTVIGTHRIPLRNIAFLDTADRELFGPVPLTNLIEVQPSAGTSIIQAQRALFDQPGVASAQPISMFTEVFEDALDQFLGFLFLAAAAVLALSLLVAFNSASISVDERTREHATLIAFGLPVRRVLMELALEGVLVGFAATAIGLGLGVMLTQWMITDVVADTVPDLSFVLAIQPATVAIAVGVGIVALASAPLLVTRRLLRMNVPDALRVME